MVLIKGEGILLRPISEDDTEFIMSIRNNLDTADQFFSDPPIYDFLHRRWLNEMEKNAIDLIIETNQRVGRIYLTNIDYRNSKAEFGIVLHTEFTGKGIAFSSSKLLLDYCFSNLPIRKIYLHVFSDNNKAISLYKKLGFLVEGVFRDEIFKKGAFKDVVRMSVFKEHWINRET